MGTQEGVIIVINGVYSSEKHSFTAVILPLDHVISPCFVRANIDIMWAINELYTLQMNIIIILGYLNMPPLLVVTRVCRA